MRAFAVLLEAHQRDGSLAAGPDCALVVAGGYDKRLAENREHFVEMQQLVAELGLQEHVRPHCHSWVCFVDQGTSGTRMQAGELAGMKQEAHNPATAVFSSFALWHTLSPVMPTGRPKLEGSHADIPVLQYPGNPVSHALDWWLQPDDAAQLPA